MRFCFRCLIVLLFLALPALAQDRASALNTAFARARHLQHGIDVSLWFAQVNDYSAARTDRFTDAADIALMARLGFDNVRLCVDPAPLEQPPLGPDVLNADFLSRLDRAVDTMLADGLAVQFNLLPKEDYKKQLTDSDEAVDRMANLWQRLAAHYATRDPEHIFFEIMNEPDVYNSRRWNKIQAQLVAAIRESAPLSTIIATGPNYSSVVDLRTIHPVDDGNVIYTFHFYEPPIFTFQGANWSKPIYRYMHGIPYPSGSYPVAQILDEAPDQAGRYELMNYWQVGWDAHHIRYLIDGAASWARKNKVPVICNEFGVFRDNVDATSRMNWLHDVRTALEADHIGWNMWDYRSGFGVVYKQDGEPATVDNAVVKALGLKAP